MTAKVEERILTEGSGVRCMPFSYKGVFRDHLDLPDCQDEGEASQTLRKVPVCNMVMVSWLTIIVQMFTTSQCVSEFASFPQINAWYGEASNTFGDACPAPCDSITYTMRSSRNLFGPR